MQYFFLTLIFLFGAALGSFVAVIANRYNTELPFLKGRSICFSCNTKLQRKDLVPIFSFLFLKGKCRFCGSKIPKETLFIEILMGALSVLAFLKSGLLASDFSFIIHNSYFIIHFFQYLLLTAIFANILLISIYDLKHFIIPDSFLAALFLLSFLHNSLFIIHNSFFYSLLQFTASGLILAIPFLLIFLISKGAWFGFGDVKYIVVLGFFLGFAQGLSAVILAFWIGAVFSLIALSLKRLAPHINLPLLRNNLTIKSEIPFGPFLSLGTIASFCWNIDLFQINFFLNVF